MMNEMRVPSFCPLCKSMMVGKSTGSFYNFGCCIMCQIFFVEGREERWKAGWRPNQEQIDSMLNELSEDR